jgi:hypothetical protein|tara:strand:- start:4985 stop:5422 length:438 start_codon:yes stop_codon:yes gene_type:complete
MIGIIKETFSVEELTDISKLSNTGDICLFTDSLLPIVDTTNLAIATATRSFDFSGILVSTCYRTTEILLVNKSSEKKIFYATDTEWTKNRNLPYEKLLNLYCHPKVKLVVSTANLYNDIENFFRKPDCIIQKWDLDQLRGLFIDV